jgi:hypothetical protein
LVLFDKLTADYGDKLTFVKHLTYTGKEWKFYAKGQLQSTWRFYNQYNNTYRFAEESILERILKLVMA